MDRRPSHLWIQGGSQADRHALLDALGLPDGLVGSVDAHQRLRGPYTAAGTVVRSLVPTVVPADSERVRRHDIEVLSVAPELGPLVPNSRQTLTSMAIPKERTRFYAPLRTRRIANGLVELVRDALPDDGRRALIFDNVEHAEATDLEFLASLLRRTDPSRLTVVICSASDALASAELLDVLSTRAVVHELTATRCADRPAAHGDPTADAWSYVAGECLSDRPGLRAAYELLDASCGPSSTIGGRPSWNTSTSRRSGSAPSLSTSSEGAILEGRAQTPCARLRTTACAWASIRPQPTAVGGRSP